MTASAGTAALVGASILGVMLALGASVDVDLGSDPSAVAIINGQPIEQAEYDRALVAVATDKRNPLTDEDRARVMARLIEEELLIQRGVEIGLVDRDRSVRGALVSAVIDHVLAPSESDPVSDEDLRAWYADNRDLFRLQPVLHVRQVEGPSGPPIPDGLVPASTLREYIGPKVLDLVLAAGPDTIVEDDAGRRFQVIARVAPEAPPLETHRTDIEAAYRRAAGDAAFRDYLTWLEARAEIERRAQ